MRVAATPQDVHATGPPAGWRCDAAQWGDGRCSCGCGIEDPECSDPAVGPVSADCAAGEMCVGGRCRAFLYAAKCDARARGTDGVCDCGCGTYTAAADPDCGFPRNPVSCGPHSPGFVPDPTRSTCEHRL